MPGNFPCHRCKATFRDQHDLNRHYEKKKKCTAIGTVVESPRLYCEPCKKSFSNKSHNNAHFLTQSHKRMMADTNVTNIVINDTAANNGESNIIAETARHIGARPSASRVVPGIFESITGVQDLRQDQFYLGFAGPPEDWSDIRRSDGTPFVPKPDQLILKYGQHILSSLRSVQHSREYGVWQVIDSILTENPPRVERDTKDDLRNRNELLSAIHKNKRSRDTELIAVNATEYKAFVEKVVKMASKYNKVDMVMEQELTKRKEAEARIAESNVRLLELQIKMKEMETSSVRTPRDRE